MNIENFKKETLINKNKRKFWKRSYLIESSQTVANLDKPAEAIRTGIFLGAEQFHLFVISLPGQVLLDHCSDLANNMYVSSVLVYNIQILIDRRRYSSLLVSKQI